MRILFLCDGMVFEVNNKTKPITSGYSYLVRDLMEALALEKDNSISCYSKNLEPEKKEWKGIKLLKRTPFGILSHIRLFYLLKGISFAKHLKLSLYDSAYLIYSYNEGGLLEKIIKEGNYDLVSIQGVTKLTVPYILACERVKAKYCVSFHALDYFQDNYTEKGQYAVQWILNLLAAKSVPTSFISTGMKEKALCSIQSEVKCKAQFKVILNGFTNIDHIQEDAREEYKIPQDAIVGLCCANITERKNQIQIIRAYNMLPENLKKNLYILLVGAERDERVRKEVQATGCEHNIIMCGIVDHENLAPFYNAADFGIVTSLSEGFGLSIIESFSFGNPVVTWSDLDAVSDLYNSEAMVLVRERSDESLAKGIEEVIRSRWDRGKILSYSRKFTINAMVEKYKKWFSLLIDS